MSENYEPFDSAEDVWFWFCACMQARGDGLRSRSDYVGTMRPCEVADIYKIIKRLKAEGRLSGRQLRVMYCWGALHCPPYYDARAKRSQIRLWDDGMRILEQVLLLKRLIEPRGEY